MSEDKKVLNYFDILNKKNMLGTSYLFIGNNPALVKEIFKLISCARDEYFCDSCWDCKAIDQDNHPDLFIVRPEPNFIKIESIREAQKFLALKSFRLKKKILFIRGGESFGLEAANAFLKTLEEPPKNSFIGICASKTEGMLPTVISRCKKIFLPFQQEVMADFFSADLVSDFFNNRRIKFRDRKEFSKFLETLMILFRDRLFSNIGLDSGLSKEVSSQIRLGHYSPKKIENILESILKIHAAHTTVNENLALNIIRALL